ncbi:MAG: cytochrome c biogenesis factor [Sphingorhabdus sp.]
MSGWIALGLLAVLSLGGLILMGRLPRAIWQLSAAAIMLAMTGYALQGRPAVPSSPAMPVAAKADAAIALIEMRADMDQPFSAAKRWLVTADAFARTGDFRLSAGYIQAGLRQNPNNPDLWSALGLQLMLASDGKMSAPAQLAFDKARALAPEYPAPDYFEGLASLFDGDLAATIAKWELALGHAPEKAKWAPRLESQLAALRGLQSGAVPPRDNVDTTP